MIVTTFDSLRTQQGKQSVTEWGDFCRLIHDVPTYLAKNAQPLIKLATFDNDSRAQGHELQQAYGIELDYDDGVITPDQAAQTLQAEGIQGIICNTYTSTANTPKWRAFLPLSKPYAAKHRAALVGACDSVLGHVVASESYREKQIFFIGRNPETDYQVIETTGKPLDTLLTMQQAARDYLQQQKAAAQATQQAEAKALQRAKVQSTVPGQIDVISAFCDVYDAGTILQNHGYQKKGKRYMAPTSRSGLAGVIILNCPDGKERAFSHHGSDPLSNGHANDAFDCFALLEHGDDTNSALQAAGDLLYMGDKTINEFNRMAYHAKHAKQTLQSIQPKNLNTIGKAARALRSLPGGFEIWQEWAGERGTAQLWQHLAKQKPLKTGYLKYMAKEAAQ